MRDVVLAVALGFGLALLAVKLLYGVPWRFVGSAFPFAVLVPAAGAALVGWLSSRMPPRDGAEEGRDRR